MANTWFNDIVTQARDSVPTGDGFGGFDDYSSSTTLVSYDTTFDDFVGTTVATPTLTDEYNYYSKFIPNQLSTYSQRGYDFMANPNNSSYVYGIGGIILVFIFLLFGAIAKRRYSAYRIKSSNVPGAHPSMKPQSRCGFMQLTKAFFVVAYKIARSSLAAFVTAARMIMCQSDMSISKRVLCVLALFFKTLSNILRDYYTLLCEALQWNGNMRAVPVVVIA